MKETSSMKRDNWKKIPAPLAVIWDFDGVLVNTIPIHARAWSQVITSAGNSFSHHLFRSGIGCQALEMARVLLSTKESDPSDEQLMALAEHKDEVYRQLLIQEPPSILPGVQKWLNYFNAEDIPQAIASSATKRNICSILSWHDIKDNFQVIISAEDVHKGKPAPDAFVLASAQLRIEHDRCIVVEDTDHGVVAAKLAGMYCIAVTTTQTRNNLKFADLVLASLDSVQPERIFTERA